MSTLSDNLAGKRLPNLPRLSFVVAFVGACLQACGHHDERQIEAETDRWSRAWQAMSATGTGQPPDQPTQNDPQPAPEPILADPSPAHARRDPGRRTTEWLPAITGFLGVAIGALIVWLAMPARLTIINRPPSKLPPAALPGAGHFASPSPDRTSATPTTQPPANPQTGKTLRPQPRPTTQTQTASTRPAPARSTSTQPTPRTHQPMSSPGPYQSFDPRPYESYYSSPYQSKYYPWPTPTR
ncbi:hypothetical protein [Actinoallomurus sp. NPDC050550]|uniref:hypothetical protein n=1 Tax=Actinoallomurus sp. NPDC050550 TaxID=3154937 RepID=UPI003409C196